MSEHALSCPDLAGRIMANSNYPSNGILGVHFAQTYAVADVGEALEAADGVENALDAHDMCIVDRTELARGRAALAAAQAVLKLRKAGVPARDTRWKIAWRELEEGIE